MRHASAARDAIEQRLAEADLVVGEAARDAVPRNDPPRQRQQADEAAEGGRVALLPNQQERRPQRRRDVLDKGERECRIEKDVRVENAADEIGPGVLVDQQRAQVGLLDGEAPRWAQVALGRLVVEQVERRLLDDIQS